MITFKTHSSRSNHHGWKAFILLAVLLISRMDAFVPLRQHQSKPTSPVSQQFLQQQSSSYDYDDTDRLIQIGRTHFASAFAFPLDDWQAHAGGAISETYNVIVCAPTGAGKTVVGEMALLHAHHQNKTSIYTTPLKALSNQKYTDLLGRFSVVGLSTGDMSINKGASVTVMTTEVYRNLAARWRSTDDEQLLNNTQVVVLDEFHYMGHPGRGSVWEESVITSPNIQIVALSATLSNAAALASWMQEVTEQRTILVQVPASQRPVPLRYLFAMKEGLYPLFRDPDAGPGSPKGLLGWRGDGVAGPAEGGMSKLNKKASSPDKLPRGLQVNPALLQAAEKRLLKVNRAIDRAKIESLYGAGRRRVSFDDDDAFSRKGPQRKLSSREERRERERLLKREMRRSVPSLSVLVRRLDQKQLLPAIFFLFSRAGCDEAARSVFQGMKSSRDPNIILRDEIDELREKASIKKRKSRQRGDRRADAIVQDSNGRTFRSRSNFVSEDFLNSMYSAAQDSTENDFDHISPLSSKNWDFFAKTGLLDYAQVQEVARRIFRFNKENGEIAFNDELTEQYLYGVGSHHAGMLPAHKSFVESLYQKQLMKVVFATETLAAGINMPARTTVICALAKRGDGSSMNLLETSNLLQMAGRAGRRGMDVAGTCVILATPFETHDDASKILTDPIKPITSQFTPSYSLAINLVARGGGSLDVARQLVSKSFAMWEKQQAERKLAAALANGGDESVGDLLKISAQERFMTTLIYILQQQLDKRTIKFNASRIQSAIDILNDRESLKNASKSYIGIAKMLELDQATLGYLHNDYEQLNIQLTDDDSDHSLLSEMLMDEQADILNQIELQRQRIVKAENECNEHPFSVICKTANDIRKQNTPEADILSNALRAARSVNELSELLDLTADELSVFAKSVVTIKRKMRKLQTSNASGESSTLQETQALEEPRVAVTQQQDSWKDMLAITKTLLAYGCLSTDEQWLGDFTDIEDKHFTLMPAGENVGMLGFENSLWTLVAIGGAWDVMETPFILDRSDYIPDDWYEPIDNDSPSKSRDDAQELTDILLSMDASELAGFVSSLVSDNSRNTGSVVEHFQRLTFPQQQAIKKVLVVMEHLIAVQKHYNVDESTRQCPLDISNCALVTAWAAGCSWNEVLELSGGVPPGDLARTLSRALDGLRQLGNLEYRPVRVATGGIHPHVRQKCREAARAMDRYPVKDPLPFESDDDDDDETESPEIDLDVEATLAATKNVTE